MPQAHPFLSGTTTLGPPITNVTITPAHPSLLHLRSRPIHLHFTLFLGPSVSIIHYPLLITTSTLNTIYITFYTTYPWPSPFHRAHTTHSAHSYIMLQLLPSAHVGWPVPQGTLSPSAGRLRRVSSLNGLGHHRKIDIHARTSPVRCIRKEDSPRELTACGRRACNFSPNVRPGNDQHHGR
jgi:hypothetical protein